MKLVLAEERGVVRILEGMGVVSKKILALRSRLNAGEIKYYEFDCGEANSETVDKFVEMINKHPKLLIVSPLIKEI